MADVKPLQPIIFSGETGSESRQIGENSPVLATLVLAVGASQNQNKANLLTCNSYIPNKRYGLIGNVMGDKKSCFCNTYF